MGEKTAGATMIVAPDDYRALPAPVIEELDRHAAEINVRAALTFELIRQIGERLETVKQTIHAAVANGQQPEKMFMGWCADHLDVSYSTLETWRNIYKRLPPLPPEVAAYITRTAAGKLAQPGSNPQGVQAALDLARDGQTITPKAGWILGRGEDYVRRQFVSGQMDEETAYDLTRALISKRLPPPVKDYCQRYEPPSAEVVKYLAEAYQRHRATEGKPRPSLTWEQVQDGVLGGFGWSVPISQARAVDLERHRADMQALHIDQHGGKYDWLQMSVTVQSDERGQIVLTISEQDAKLLRAHIGSRLVQKLRIPRGNL